MYLRIKKLTIAGLMTSAITMHVFTFLDWICLADVLEQKKLLTHLIIVDSHFMYEWSSTDTRQITVLIVAVSDVELTITDDHVSWNCHAVDIKWQRQVVYMCLCCLFYWYCVYCIVLVLYWYLLIICYSLPNVKQLPTSAKDILSYDCHINKRTT